MTMTQYYTATTTTPWVRTHYILLLLHPFLVLIWKKKFLSLFQALAFTCFCFVWFGLLFSWERERDGLLELNLLSLHLPNTLYKISSSSASFSPFFLMLCVWVSWAVFMEKCIVSGKIQKNELLHSCINQAEMVSAAAVFFPSFYAFIF